MPRGRKNKTRCQRHDLSLNPMNAQCYFGQTITTNFCDLEKEKQSSRKNQKSVSSCLHCPIYNEDGNYATPTFIL